MIALRAVLQAALADVRERTRRGSFLATMVGTLYLAYLVATGWVVVRVGGYRGIATSAWVGSQISLVIATLLSLVGFYLVRGSVTRDRDTGVGEILATTALSRVQYVLAKLVSNTAVLGTIVAVLAAAAVALQSFAGEAPLELGALLAPFALLALPAMALVAALAVLFETLPGLRGGLGNVVFFMVWMALLVLAIQGGGAFDFGGFGLLHDSMNAALAAAHPGHPPGLAVQISPPRVDATFFWPGIAWSAPVVVARLAWFAVALGVTLVGALAFDRFDPARRRRGGARTAAAPAVADPLAPTPGEANPAHPAAAALPALVAADLAFSPWRLLRAELRVLVAGRSRWWFVAAFGLLVGQLVAPAAAVVHPWLVLAWIWPLLLWSPLGGRARRSGVHQVLWTAPRPVLRQLLVEWLAGVVLAAAVGGGAAVRLAMAGDLAGVSAWAAACLAIPALAVALGVLSGGTTAFEAVWLLWWYLGLLQRAPFLDLAGSSPAALGRSAPWAVAGAAAALVGLAAAVRARQVRGG